MQRPEHPRPTQAGQRDQAQQQPPQQPPQQPGQSSKANTHETAKPAAAKSKARAPTQATCQQSEEPSSSSTAGQATTSDSTRIATLLAQQPPFTAMQHGMPLLRDLLAYQVRAHPDNQPAKQAAMAAPPPPPPPTLEEQQLSLQIAQALTVHIQAITKRILATNNHPMDNYHQPHHNDVITIDSQDTQEEPDQQPSEQPPKPQPEPQTTKPLVTDAATQQSATQGQPGDVHTQPWWILGHPQPSTAAALQPTTTNMQPHTHPVQQQDTTYTTNHRSTSSHTSTQADNGNQSERATQPWWILGKPSNRSRSPQRSRQNLDLFHAPVDQQMTQYDDEADTDNGLDDDKPIAGPDN